MYELLYGDGTHQNGDETIQEKLEFKWTDALSKPKSNLGGTTGWAHIHRRSGGVTHDPPEVCRVHICRNNPCTADWARSKYGPYGPPIHVQQLEWPADLAAYLTCDVRGGTLSP